MRNYIKFSFLFILPCFLVLQACAQTNNESKETKIEKQIEPTFKDEKGQIFERIVKSEEEWKKELTEEEFYILREKGTERAFSGDLLKNKEVGVYTCAACGLPLFSSKTKFDSGTGWPSYYEPVDQNYIEEEVDSKYGMVRTEVLCNRCKGHLGHVFNDGPQPTGLRYCINAASLNFKSDKEGS